MKTTTALSLFVIVFALVPGRAAAQGEATASNPVTQSLKGLQDITVTNLTKTAEMLEDSMYAYRPTDEVRTAGQILAHVANSQFAFCAGAAGEKSPNEQNYEETATTKADILAALKAGFAYCDQVYAKMTDADGAKMHKFFGNDMAASGILAFNAAHNYEHYGNLVTYMRMNHIVPPSSQRSN